MDSDDHEMDLLPDSLAERRENERKRLDLDQKRLDLERKQADDACELKIKEQELEKKRLEL